MSYTARRCNDCSFPVLGHTPSCPRCGGTNLVLVGGPPLADLIAQDQHAPAKPSPFNEEPMVRCACCLRRIEASQAYHSGSGGLAVCWSCKQAEEA
jgi:hypothetical protein